jgi:hypothetical protein
VVIKCATSGTEHVRSTSPDSWRTKIGTVLRHREERSLQCTPPSVTHSPLPGTIALRAVQMHSYIRMMIPGL